MEKVKEEKGNNFPMVLVGNKIDLEQRREIEKEKGELLAEKNGIDFYEVSNKEGINIQEAGLAIVHKILEKRRKDSIVETERSSKVSSLTYYSKYSNVDNDSSGRHRCCF